MKTLPIRKASRTQVRAIENPIDADLSTLPVSVDAEIPKTPVQINAEVAYLKNRVEFFRNYLRDMFYRNQQEIDAEIQKHVDKVMSVSSPALVYGFIDYYYTYEWWRNEPDTNFKRQLAPALLAACKSRVPDFSNAVLEKIANGLPEASFILGSFIEE